MTRLGRVVRHFRVTLADHETVELTASRFGIERCGALVLIDEEVTALHYETATGAGAGWSSAVETIAHSTTSTVWRRALAPGQWLEITEIGEETDA